MVIRPKLAVVAAIAVTLIVALGIYVEHSYEGDTIARESVVVLAMMLGGAAWLTERRLLRSNRASSDSKAGH